MSELACGNIRKMKTQINANNQAQYQLPLDDALVDMNSLVGQSLTLNFLGEINCVHCDRLTKKTFNQGYCYPCFKRLAQCDSCIMSPEKCHFDQGTCREPEWGEANCNIDHFVYLANSSGLKVGITRHSQIPTRWVDQGAVQALPMLRVATRFISGLVEVEFKALVNDKTNWRKMLKNEVDTLDLVAERERLLHEQKDALEVLSERFGLQAIQPITDTNVTEIVYPVLEYPVKVSSLNLDKTPTVGGTLMGIKGQYLIFDTGVINMRKYAGYRLQVTG